MQFCPKCGSILMPRKRGKKTVVRCSCGYSSKEKKDFVLKEKVVINNKVEVEEKKVEPLPEVDIECPKCRNKKAYYWTIQTRAGDEAETIFYKCSKCEHSWRQY